MGIKERCLQGHQPTGFLLGLAERIPNEFGRTFDGLVPSKVLIFSFA
jgi:hypothetical protein